MNNKKEVEREELHKTIWKIANELRGSVDGWDFKQYVLGLLFIDSFQKISKIMLMKIKEKQVLKVLSIEIFLMMKRYLEKHKYLKKRDYLFYLANYFVTLEKMLIKMKI